MDVTVFQGKIVVHNAKYNLCDGKPKPDLIRSNIAGWAIPDFCPVKEKFTMCYNGSKILTLSVVTQRMFGLFVLAKGSKIRLSITHDTGTSCFEATSSLSRYADQAMLKVRN